MSEDRITVRAFLWKTVKEKQFYWKKNLFYSLLPIIFVLLVLVELNAKNETTRNDELFEPETEVN
jgi:hypothetical protein